MTVRELIEKLEGCPPYVKEMTVCVELAPGVDYPIMSGRVAPDITNHDTMVDRPERFVLGK